MVCAGIAQLVEQRIENPRVTSSSLVLGNKKRNKIQIGIMFITFQAMILQAITLPAK